MEGRQGKQSGGSGVRRRRTGRQTPAPPTPPSSLRRWLWLHSSSLARFLPPTTGQRPRELAFCLRAPPRGRSTSMLSAAAASLQMPDGSSKDTLSACPRSPLPKGMAAISRDCRHHKASSRTGGSHQPLRHNPTSENPGGALCRTGNVMGVCSQRRQRGWQARRLIWMTPPALVRERGGSGAKLAMNWLSSAQFRLNLAYLPAHTRLRPPTVSGALFRAHSATTV